MEKFRVGIERKKGGDLGNLNALVTPGKGIHPELCASCHAYNAQTYAHTHTFPLMHALEKQRCIRRGGRQI
jgi:hypothetical protein